MGGLARRSDSKEYINFVLLYCTRTVLVLIDRMQLNVRRRAE